MRTEEEIKSLCESRTILDIELTKEEALLVNCSEMNVQDSIEFIKKYGHYFKDNAVSANKLINILNGL